MEPTGFIRTLGIAFHNYLLEFIAALVNPSLLQAHYVLFTFNVFSYLLPIVYEIVI